MSYIINPTPEVSLLQIDSRTYLRISIGEEFAKSLAIENLMHFERTWSFE
jgi:hypothetical protein